MRIESDGREFVLHEDEINLFYGHRDYVEWVLEDRVITIGWQRPEGWERFKAMVEAVGHVPWAVI